MPRCGFRARMALAAVLLLICSFHPAAATESISTRSAVERDPIRIAIEKQLHAFKDRDSRQAYAALSAESQARYKSPLRFVTMMRLQFWALYNHSSYRFLGQSGAIQKVEVQADDDKPRVFLFRLVNSEGHWLIDKVVMLDADAQPV